MIKLEKASAYPGANGLNKVITVTAAFFVECIFVHALGEGTEGGAEHEEKRNEGLLYRTYYTEVQKRVNENWG